MKYVIDITTLRIKRGRGIKPITPDKDGVFRKVPAFVLGKGSRSTDYDPDSLYQSITREGSAFKLKIEEGNCEGEYGHPLLTGANPEADIRRLFHIERTRLSHTIHGVSTSPLENGDVLGMIDIKPGGPNGQYLRESLMDTVVNTGFSMRTFCHPPKMQDNGRYYKKVKEIITIDSEGTPGWEEASKRFRDGVSGTISVESFTQFSSECTSANIISVINNQTKLGNEAMNNQLFDLLQSDTVIIEDTSYIIDISNRTLMSQSGESKNIFHTFFK